MDSSNHLPALSIRFLALLLSTHHPTPIATTTVNHNTSRIVKRNMATFGQKRSCLSVGPQPRVSQSALIRLAGRCTQPAASVPAKPRSPTRLPRAPAAGSPAESAACGGGSAWANRLLAEDIGQRFAPARRTNRRLARQIDTSSDNRSRHRVSQAYRSDPYRPGNCRYRALAATRRKQSPKAVLQRADFVSSVPSYPPAKSSRHGETPATAGPCHEQFGTAKFRSWAIIC